MRYDASFTINFSLKKGGIIMKKALSILLSFVMLLTFMVFAKQPSKTVADLLEFEIEGSSGDNHFFIKADKDQTTAEYELSKLEEQGLEVYFYQVFSTYVIDEEEYYITTTFNSDEEYSSFIKRIKSRSNYDYGVDVTKDDKVLTLSSCAGYGNKRVVLHAKNINE